MCSDVGLLLNIRLKYSSGFVNVRIIPSGQSKINYFDASLHNGNY